jgi:hypothetical protein
VSVPVEVVDGVACVQLPADRKRELVRYEVRAVPAVGGWRSWAVEQVDDTTADHHHTVGTDGERWRCTCRDHLYRGRQRLCKHCAAVAEVLEFYAKLTGVE